jgi:hypothetical protein
MASNIVSAERLRELFHYDPETGVFIHCRAVGRWGRVPAGSRADTTFSHNYRRVRVDREAFPAHRLAWFWMTNKWPTHQIDHIDGDPTNNRWSNLREVTDGQNKQNQKAHRKNSSGLLGVSWYGPSKLWTARIQVEGKQRYLGRFNTPEEAHAAYLKAKRELHPFGML